MRRIAIVVAMVSVVGLGACLWMLPERFAVNAPIGHMMFGFMGRDTPPPEVIDRRMKGPSGFEVGIFADGIERARGLRFTSAGDLLVSQPQKGRILLLEADRDHDGRSDGSRVLLKDLDRPHGMDFHEGFLYVAETGGFGRVPFDPGSGAGQARITGDYTRLVDDLPAGGNHWTRTLRIGPDERVYVSVGSSCNVCLEEDPNRRAALLRFALDGSGEETVATGLRNTVGFDWRPSTGDLYGTDNGRDLLGDDFPPCELNLIREGQFYGWPFANGDRVPDPDFGEGEEARIAASLPPAYSFQAHNAPLGMAFVRDLGDLTERGDVAIVALHGSWNRTAKDGYKVVSLHFGDAGEIEQRDFLTGFMVDEDVIGRPVDVVQGPDGAIYISDDYSNSVWRVNVRGQGAASAPVAIAQRTASDTPLAGLAADERLALSKQGAVLFADNRCATCHDASNPVPGIVAKPLDKLIGRFDLSDLEQLIETPPPPMPVFDLSPQDRRALAVYLLGKRE